jgi:hypothetical protein
MPKREVREPKPLAEGKPGGRPGDDFNSRSQWSQILEPFGCRPVFERDGEIFWRRPGKTEGILATAGFARLVSYWSAPSAPSLGAGARPPG